ncbi:MAG: hypothetical protein ACK5JT_20120 [Hyphomicrobiaceae bacterium]
MPNIPARTLLIAYEIAPNQAVNPKLTEAIMTLGEAWARPLDTVWLLRTTREADVIESCLAPLVGDDDGLVVQETKGSAFLVNTGVRWFRPRGKVAADMEPNRMVARNGSLAEVHQFPGAGAFDRAA